MLTFTTSSKYATLTPYMLLEYMYADQPTPETYPVNSGTVTVGFDKLVNGYMSDDIQIFNPLVDLSVTNNTVNNNVVRIDQSNYVALDSDLIIPFNDFDDKLTNTNDLPINFPSNINVVYDTVRFHIRAGYNLSNLDGVIVSIKYNDQDNSYVTVASILIKKGTQQVYVLNTKPVTIGSDIYDKYVEVKIPNLLDMQNKYLAASPGNKANTLAGKISKSGNGFNSISPIRISIDEVKSITDYNGYTKYGTQNVATFSLSQEDPFKEIGAIIRPSDNGEFFEYFATDNGGFVEDFILFQNSIGNSYYIYHQIEVLEQIGASFIETSNFSNIQTNAYDVPNLFRPIVRNSSVANSFVLRYTMSLVNNKDQTRVIRIGTYTSNKPGRYGTRITPLSISQDPQTYKIYNKLYDQPSINMVNLQQREIAREVVKYSNIFIQQNKVTTSVTNLVAKTNSVGTPSLSPEQGQTEEVVYGRGNAIIEISPFDNYYKFLFYVNGPDDIPNLIDLESSGSYKLVFIDNKGAKLKIPSIVDKNIANPAKGELAFKIGEDISSKILQFSNRKYYISNIPMDSNDSLASGPNSIADSLSGVVEISYRGTRTLSLKRDTSNTSVKAQGVTIEPKKRNAVTDVTSSVLYWGKWKKEEEEVTQTPIIIPRRNIPSYATIPSYRNRAIPGLSSDVLFRDSSVKTIKPTSGQSSSGTSVPQQVTPVYTAALTGSALISAVSTLIYSFDSTGWTPQQIYTYFFVPGNPGYVTYPSLTQTQFEQAANGILSPTELSILFQNVNVVTNQSSSSTTKITML